MIDSLLHAVTDYGDSSVTSTFTFVTALFFWYHKQRRAAAAIVGAFVTASVLIVLSKVILYSRCNASPLAFFDLKSPSGHSALSMSVYGTFAAIVSTSLKGKRKAIPLVIALAFVGLIIVSRVELNYHSIGDVIVGASAGLATTFAMWLLLLRGHIILCPWRIYSGMIVVAMLIVHGLHLPAESVINLVAKYFHGHVRKC